MYTLLSDARGNDRSVGSDHIADRFQELAADEACVGVAPQALDTLLVGRSPRRKVDPGDAAMGLRSGGEAARRASELSRRAAAAEEPASAPP